MLFLIEELKLIELSAFRYPHGTKQVPLYRYDCPLPIEQNNIYCKSLIMSDSN